MRKARGLLAVSLVGVALSACGGDDPTVSESPGRTGRTVSVEDNSFVPAELTVSVGTEVIWTDRGDNPHSIKATDGSFDSHPNCPGEACMKNGDTFKHTFSTAGRFTYSCNVHGELMSGAIVVQ